MSNVDTALKLFEDGNSCAQAVLAAYCTKVDLDQSIAIKIGSGLGGGIGRRQHVCGAINAGAIILGLKYSKGIAGEIDSKEKASEMVGKFVTECENILGSAQCKNLLKIDLTNEKEKMEAKESGLFERVCNNAVKQSSIVLEKYLDI